MSHRLFWLAVLSFAFPGGISAQSVHPFFKEDDLVFKPELLGQWKLAGEVTLEFREAGNRTYGVILKLDKDAALYFRVRLLRIDGRYFMDGQVVRFQLASEGPQANPDEAGTGNAGDFEREDDDILYNRLHGLFLVSFTSNPDEFFVSTWEKSWLPLQAEQDLLRVPHTKDESQRILLIGETEDLREFARNLPPEAFDKPEKLERVKAESAHKPYSKEPQADRNPRKSAEPASGAGSLRSGGTGEGKSTI